MRLNVYVKTGKNESKVVKKDFGEYEVWVKARPIKGKANKELIEVLSDYFNVNPNKLIIIKGMMTPRKLIELLGQ